jgi:hypothetical protein
LRGIAGGVLQAAYRSHGARWRRNQHGGKGCWRDNVFVERLWKTIEYEHVYLHAYATVSGSEGQARRVHRFLTTAVDRTPRSNAKHRTPHTSTGNRLSQPPNRRAITQKARKTV